MGQVVERGCGVRAIVCLLLALAAWLQMPATLHAEPLELAGSDAELGVVIYPATTPGSHFVTVVLHGMCGEPRNTCRNFERAVTAHDHLVCPRASRRCEGGGASWSQTGFEQPVERAVERAEALLGARVAAAGGRTLIGYSLGAYRALDLAQRSAGKYPRVLLIGARVQANQRLLRDSGVERLMLSAGAWDMTHGMMRREAARLARGGFQARFLGLGPVGHTLTPTFPDYLRDAWAWLHPE